ncbi:hypothetical protein FGO68_gene10862 [Halteria grandinella]|uniref:Uncharacterized protein n=1 Tax=Halteria grandinella TaxID=5974 RepID=A0A8J8NCE6_HALGN|nr:hypothetical protein FGO68_gene10862 [Halteria grandinella]
MYATKVTPQKNMKAQNEGDLSSMITWIQKLEEHLLLITEGSITFSKLQNWSNSEQREVQINNWDTLSQEQQFLKFTQQMDVRERVSLMGSLNQNNRDKDLPYSLENDVVKALSLQSESELIKYFDDENFASIINNLRNQLQSSFAMLTELDANDMLSRFQQLVPILGLKLSLFYSITFSDRIQLSLFTPSHSDKAIFQILNTITLTENVSLCKETLERLDPMIERELEGKLFQRYTTIAETMAEIHQSQRLKRAKEEIYKTQDIPLLQYSQFIREKTINAEQEAVRIEDQIQQLIAKNERLTRKYKGLTQK